MEPGAEQSGSRAGTLNRRTVSVWPPATVFGGSETGARFFLRNTYMCYFQAETVKEKSMLNI